MVFMALMGRKETVTPAENETTVVRSDTSDLCSLVSFDKVIELTAVFTDDKVTTLSADNKAGSVLHPGMTDVAVSALSVLKLAAHVVKLTVFTCELCLTNLVVLVSAWSSNDHRERVLRVLWLEWVERDLEGWGALGV